MPADNTGLAKVLVQCSASTFVVKIATLGKPESYPNKDPLLESILIDQGKALTF